MAVITNSLALNKNAIYNGTVRTALFNMIISQQVYDLNVKPNTKLLDAISEEVAGYGDSKLFYFSDVLESRDFIAGIDDGTNQNVLATHRPNAITIQEITLDKVRQVEVTVDDFLVKQGFQTEGAYSQLMSVFQSAVEKTKQIHLAQTANTFIGTDKNDVATDHWDIPVSSYSASTGVISDKEEAGAEIAEGVANLLTELADISREYTDDEYLRSFDASELTLVVNAKYANMIQKRVLPFIFGPDKLTAGTPDVVVLPERYFGTVSSATTSAEGARTLVEIKDADGNKFPGDVVKTGTTVAANSTYTVDPTIICKVIAKNGVKMLRSFNTTESFRNARAHNTNYYMCFGYSYPEHLVDFPVIEVKIAE